VRRQLAEAGWVIGGQAGLALGTVVGVRILTQYLAPDAYGVVSLSTGMSVLAISLVATPLTQAAIHFYPAIAANGSARELLQSVLRCFRTTTPWVVIATLVAGGLYVGLGQGSAMLVVVLALLLASDCWRSANLSLLNAARRQRAYALWMAADAWSRPLAATAAVLLVGQSPVAVLAAYVLVSAVLVGVFSRGLWPKGPTGVPESSTSVADAGGASGTATTASVDGAARVAGAAGTAAMTGAARAVGVAGTAAMTGAARPAGVAGTAGVTGTARPAGVAGTAGVGDAQRARELDARMWSYALPLLPLGLIAWASNLGDRYVIGGVLSVADAGVYAAVYGLSSMPFMIVNGTAEQALRPIYQAAVTNGNRLRARKILLLWLGIVVGVCALGVLLFAFGHTLIAAFFVGKPYRHASGLMPLIATGYAIRATSYVFERVCYAYGQTRRVLLIQLWAVAATAVATPLGVVYLGLKGAALAVPLYFSVQLLVAIFLARRTLSEASAEPVSVGSIPLMVGRRV
jgi:O-antigen/teichoic acid export membrane protein